MDKIFKEKLDRFEAQMHMLDDSKRPQHDTLIDPPDADGEFADGWSTEYLRYFVYLRRRIRETYGTDTPDISDGEKKEFIKQVKQEFLAERKAAVSKAASKKASDD